MKYLDIILCLLYISAVLTLFKLRTGVLNYGHSFRQGPAKMSDSFCIACQRPVTSRQEAISCDDCEQWQHRTCSTGISRPFYRRLVREERSVSWRCLYCIETDDEPDHEPVEIVTDPTVDEPDTFHEPMPVDQSNHQPVEESFHAETSFQVPQPLHEESVVDEPIGDLSIGDMLVEYEIVQSGTSRGNSKLVDNRGFSYTLKKQKEESLTWRCSVRRKNCYCPATVLQHGQTFTDGAKKHIHPPNPGAGFAVKMKAEVRRCIFVFI